MVPFQKTSSENISLSLAISSWDVLEAIASQTNTGVQVRLLQFWCLLQTVKTSPQKKRE
jgi:hypothetical protein